jgi:hypothetical protein
MSKPNMLRSSPTPEGRCCLAAIQERKLSTSPDLRGGGNAGTRTRVSGTLWCSETRVLVRCKVFKRRDDGQRARGY